MYDVLVIGAGPAGCMAAKRIANEGYNVLLADKMELPREKSCSGILIQKSVKMVEAEFGEIPETVFSHPAINRGIIITNEKGKTFKFESEGYNIWRNLFDNHLTIKAEDAGAELRTSTPAISSREKDGYAVVKFKDREEKARMVIACDGASSRIKMNVMASNRVTDNISPIITYQTFCRGTIDLDPGFFHAFLDPKLSQYDAWFNVKDEYLIMGVGVKDASLMKHYHSKFVSYLKSQYHAQIESFERREVGLMPHIHPDFKVNLGKGRVLFAGDAAHLLNPMGEGISSALASGYAASEAIKNEFESGSDPNPGNVLNQYNKKLKPEIEYMMRQWRFLGTISPEFGSFLK